MSTVHTYTYIHDAHDAHDAHDVCTPPSTLHMYVCIYIKKIKKKRKKKLFKSDTYFLVMAVNALDPIRPSDWRPCMRRVSRVHTYVREKKEKKRVSRYGVHVVMDTVHANEIKIYICIYIKINAMQYRDNLKPPWWEWRGVECVHDNKPRRIRPSDPPPSPHTP